MNIKEEISKYEEMPKRNTLKLPEIKVLPQCEGSIVHFVFVGGDAKYKCITKERAESFKDMAEALISVYQDLETCDDWGTDISTSTIEKVIVSLNKFGMAL